MKKLLFLLLAAAAGYFAWTRFGPSRAPPAANPREVTPAANATQRIDNLSGAAPQ